MKEQFERVPALCGADGEFRLAARYWTGSLRLEAGDERRRYPLQDGAIGAGEPADGHPDEGAGHVTVSAPPEVWQAMLEPLPRPYLHDLFAAQIHGVVIGGDFETSCQYYPALRRLVELLRRKEA